MRLVYVIGNPGAGKSTAVRSALAHLGCTAGQSVEVPIAHTRHQPSPSGLVVWEMGRQRAAFSGTDALAMNVQPKAIRWVEALQEPGANAPDVLIGEGDRLATRGFLLSAPDLTLVLVNVPIETAQARGIARAADIDRPAQQASWFRGRCTKVANLAETLPCHSIDGLGSPEAVAEQLAAIIGGDRP